ncbi:MAG: hypothetical protein KDC47_10465, partial [Flavobacteriaceae bacterium]|nr:hypothetical protein [Flavobacteriaceae bacterium]
IVFEDFPYSVFKKPVNEDQINQSDFRNFIKWLYYDDVSGCLYNFPNDGGIYDFSDYVIYCPDSNSPSFESGGDGGGGTTSTGSLNNTTSNPPPPLNPTGSDTGDNSSGSSGGGSTSTTNNENNDITSSDPNSPVGILTDEDYTICDPGYVKDNNGLCVLDKIIVDPQLEEDYPCQSVIIEDSFQRSAPLSKLILNVFDSDDSGYNLVFWNDTSIGDETAGGTYPISENSMWNYGKLDINIGLSNALLDNSTDLAIVTTTIHESLHGLFIYMMETGKLTVDNSSNNQDLSTFVRLFLEMQIKNEKFPNITPSVAQVDSFMHNYMTNFVEDIATVVSAYGKSAGYSLPFSYYRDLSWLGLVDSLELILWHEGENLSEEEQAELDRIRNIAVNEFQNKQDAKGKKCVN